MDHLIIVLVILFSIYITVLGFVFSDLWSGLRKARRRGEIRTSYGLRKTVEKIGKYYNMLFAITLIDCIHMGIIWYLDSFYNYDFPMLPIFTAVAAIFVGIIEIKSIYEKAEDKVKVDYQQVGIPVSRIMQNKTEPEEIAKAVIEYMNENKLEKEIDYDNPSS